MTLYVSTNGRTNTFYVTKYVKNDKDTMTYGLALSNLAMSRLPNPFFIQADGDELAFLLEAFPYLREKLPSRRHLVIRWYGDEARYLLANLPNYLSIPIK